jgi:hypothetical protein
MQAWKSIDFSTTRHSPVQVLSFSTAEWALRPFPRNLVAINTTWVEAQAKNQSLRLSWYDPDAGAGLITNGRYTVANTEISCEDLYSDGCLIVIEGAGSRTSGPTASNTAGLAYGLVFLIAGLLTTAIMGCFHSVPREQGGGGGISEIKHPIPDPIERDTLPNIYNPHDRRRIDAERAAIEAGTTKEIQKCAALLREMYRLDLEIWGTEGVQGEDQASRDEMMRRSDALFGEVRRIAYRWQHQPRDGWTAEEGECMDEILRAIAEQPAIRYHSAY